MSFLEAYGNSAVAAHSTAYLVEIDFFSYHGRFPRLNQMIRGEENNAQAENNVRPENNNPNQQNEAQGEGQAAPAALAEQVTNAQGEARTNGNEENGTDRRGALAFTWMFFSSFFASLIPDQPNVM